MKKIAIFNCQFANQRCTGAGCIQAFNERSGAFASYGANELQLVSFTRCNGCGQDWENDEGLAKKIVRIEALADVVHFGGCTFRNGQECSFITQLAGRLAADGMTVVRGTHVHASRRTPAVKEQ